MKRETMIADGMRIDYDEPIAMDDGVILRADVYRPLADGRYPVLMAHAPYGKGRAFTDGRQMYFDRIQAFDPPALAQSSNRHQVYETLDPEQWTRRGYVCVRVDCRGAGASPGFQDPWSAREARDFHDAVEWAAVQDWSNGKVGVSGISYYAMTAWQVAGLNPPHLAAICAWEGGADYYRDVFRHGGIMSDFCGPRPTADYPFNFYESAIMAVQHGQGERGPRSRVRDDTVCGPTLPPETLVANRADLYGGTLAHPLDDDFTRSRSPVLEAIRAPVLSAANWGGQGLHGRGNFEGYMRAGSAQKWLEVHGNDHFCQFYARYGQDLQARFFDHFLKGEENGWDREPPVRLHIRRPGERFEQRMETEWPLARTAWTPLYLDLDAKALSWNPPGAAGTASYRGLGQGVTLFSPPLAQETEITGPVAAKLFVSSSTADADLFLVLRLFDPHGEEVVFQGSLDAHTPIGQGWLRVSHRKLDPAMSKPWRPYHSHDEAQPMTPGEVYEVDVEIWPTCIVVPAGYRLGLSIQGKDYEYAGADPWNHEWPSNGCGPFTHLNSQDRPSAIFDGQVTLHAGPARQAHLLLPVIPTIPAAI